MTKHYLVFHRTSAAVVDLVRAPTPLAAIQQHFLEEDTDSTFRDDGTVIKRHGRRTIVYPHALAYVEANYKIYGEWQMRELPESAWMMDSANLFSGENPAEIRFYIRTCLPLLRQQSPRARPGAFVWHLRQGTLVTFYRRVQIFQIEVLQRYLVEPDQRISLWNGDYNAILNKLSGPPGIGRWV